MKMIKYTLILLLNISTNLLQAASRRPDCVATISTDYYTITLDSNNNIILTADGLKITKSGFNGGIRYNFSPGLSEHDRISMATRFIRIMTKTESTLLALR